MSVSFVTNPNPYVLHGASMNVSGIDQAGNLTAPIVTSSNVLCANLYVARAQTADNFSGNVSANATIDGWLDTTANVTVGSDLVIGGNLTVGGVINGSISNSLTSNVSLVAYSVNGGNVTGQVANSAVSTVALSAYAVDGANVSGQVASAAVSTVALTAYAVDGGNVSGQVASAAVADVAYSVDGGNVVGQVSDSLHSDWADTANIAIALATTGSPVNVSLAAPGTAGQILKLTSATTAVWDDESGGGNIANTTIPGWLDIQSNVTVGTDAVINGNLTVNGTINGGGASGGGVLQSSSFTMSSADILNLDTTAVTVLAAPGAGKAFAVEHIRIRTFFGTTAYSGGANLIFTYTPSGTLVHQQSQAAFTQSSDYFYYFDTNIERVDLSTNENEGISLSTPTAFTGGDGTAEIILDYYVVTI